MYMHFLYTCRFQCSRCTYTIIVTALIKDANIPFEKLMTNGILSNLHVAVVAEGTKDKGQDHFQLQLLSGVFIGIVGFGVITVVVLGSMIAVIGHLKRSLKKGE